MSIQPQYKSNRYMGEVCRLHSQSMVECRLPGSEIGSVLSVHAVAIPTENSCLDGEVRYGGKMMLCLVYEDGERNVCRVERGAEFYHKAEGALVTPACFSKVALQPANITSRREGSGLYISVVIDAEIIVYGSKQMEYFDGGDGLVTQKRERDVWKNICVSGETEGEDVFETDYACDVLMHSEQVLVTRVRAGAGQIEVDGELALHVCVLKTPAELCSYERIIPIHMQIPSEEAFGEWNVGARVNVKSAQLHAGLDEEAGKSQVQFSYTLSADCFMYAKERVEFVDDAFSPLNEIVLQKKNEQGRYLTNCIKCMERVSGICSVSPAMDLESALVGVMLPRGEAVCKKQGEGFEVEGAVQAELLLKHADGGYKSCTIALPFVFPVELSGADVEADVLVCGLNVRKRKDGQTEAEATVKLCLRVYECAEYDYVCTVEEGQARVEKDAAVSVYTLHQGETLWEISKRLVCSPEEVLRNNPGLVFPIREGESIFIYRQIK